MPRSQFRTFKHVIQVFLLIVFSALVAHEFVRTFFVE